MLADPKGSRQIESIAVFNRLNAYSFCWRRMICYHNDLAMSPNHESPSVAVERALAMLEAVAQEPDGLSNAEISRKLQIPKSSASYILRTLEKQAYLKRDEETGKYRVGLKILSLSRGALSGIDVREVALPVMRHLMEKTNLTCHLAILDGPEAVYIEKVEPQGFIRMDTWVGRRMRVHATSVGKALVAHIPQERLEKILADRGMEKRTPKTITTVPRLLKDLEKVRAQGYAVDDEENNMGARCLGAPVFNQSGGIEASIGLSGTTNQVNAQTMPRILEALKDAARHVSMQLGYRPPHRRVSGG